MKQTFALRGNLVYTKKIGTMEILEQQYLVCEDGRVQGIYPELPQQFCGIPVEDMGDRIIIPGLTDLHVHAPQYSFRTRHGSGASGLAEYQHLSGGEQVPGSGVRKEGI